MCDWIIHTSQQYFFRCLLLSPPSREKLKLDHEVYIKSNAITSTAAEEESEIETDVAAQTQ